MDIDKGVNGGGGLEPVAQPQVAKEISALLLAKSRRAFNPTIQGFKLIFDLIYK